MLSNVTWSEYLGVVVTILIFYYLFIAFKYYREDLKALWSGKLSWGNYFKSKQRGATEDQTNSTLFEELEDVVNDLKYAVLDKAGSQVSKPDLLDQLQQRLANYHGLGKPAYRVAINNFIIKHAQETCGVVYSEEELNSAWDALPR